MAATVDTVVESKAKKPTSVDNSAMEVARAKGAIAIAIAKLQPSVRLLIAYAKLWAYYTLIPFKMGQLTIDVVVLGLEITKLFLMSVKANTNVFVQLFQQILAIFSPDFIQSLILSFSNILMSLVEKIMTDLLKVVQKFVDGLTTIFNPPMGFQFPGRKSETLSDAGAATEPTQEAAAAQQSTVNGEKPQNSDKSDKTGTSQQPEKSPPKKV